MHDHGVLALTTASERRPRFLRAILAAIAALALAVPLLGPWDEAAAQDDASPAQYVGDAQNTWSSPASGPADPGLKWYRDFSEPRDAEMDFAPEGYSLAMGTRHQGMPIDAGDVIIVRASNQDPQHDDGARSVIGVDADDGTVLWEVPGVAGLHGGCQPAVDSQDRVWIVRWGDNAVAAFDLTDGEEIADTRIERDNRPCGNTSLHITGDGDDEYLIAWGSRGDVDAFFVADISGDEPEVVVEFDDADDAGFDEIVGVPGVGTGGANSFYTRPGVATDDSVIMVVRVAVDDDDDEVLLVELELATGDERGRVTLPIPAFDPDHDDDPIDPTAYSLWQLMLADDDTLVYGPWNDSAFRGPDGFAAAIDISDGLSATPLWLERFTDTDSPGRLALGDGVVLVQPGNRGTISGYDLASGAVVWDSEYGTGPEGGVNPTDVDGAIYSLRTLGGTTQQILTGLDPQGTERWYIQAGSIRQEVADTDDAYDEPDDVTLSISGNVVVGALGQDGTVFVGNRQQQWLLAIDNSGGLGEFPDTLPDVDDRVAGEDRFETAADICAAFVDPNPDNVYVATGLAFPDALTGGVPAAMTNTCMLLTAGSFLPDRTIAELERLEPDAITVLGGTAAVQAQVEQELNNYTDGPVRRLEGADRFETSAAISTDTFEPASTRTAFVATGVNFPDALAGAPPAAAFEAPILLVTSQSIPQATAAELERLDLDQIIVLGGPNVIGPKVEADLSLFADDVHRVAGDDRFDTSVQVGDLLVGQDPPEPLMAFVATGVAFPDALAGGAVAGAIPGPIYLVGRDFTPDVVTAELDRVRPDRLVIFGGEAAVSAANEQRLRDAAGLE